ncbi:hypothetical protein [Moraxella sp.]|uniref:hypothetical protein n=1 Tax=Moraxella sp. TaxID=479 RepID=UPI0026DD3940|nr:hypothetical protein [Moraxella sp.]MDO4894366.1 hypothetical protein [Moraxella sp.]
MATELSIVLKASSAIGGAMTAIKTLTSGLEGVKRSSNILSNEHKNLRNEINRLGSTTSVAKLQRQYEMLGGTIKGLRKNAVKQIGIQTKLENKAQARADMQSQVMGLVGTGLTLTAPIKLAIDFESAMADVKKVVDFGDDPIIAKSKLTNDDGAKRILFCLEKI